MTAPVPGSDTNPRCDRCKHTAHPHAKCPLTACGCRIHRDPQ